MLVRFEGVRSILRFRFTVRRMMAVVALVALGAWGWRVTKLQDEYREKAVIHSFLAANTSLSVQNSKDQIEIETRLIGLLQSQGLDIRIQDRQKALDVARENLARSMRQYARHTRLKAKYERAARYPWLWFEADPPDPE
jgi:hypothetical protein